MGREHRSQQSIMDQNQEKKMMKQTGTGGFATGMNGDEDLGEDIIMKGEPYHYHQKKENSFVQWNPVVVESTGPLPAFHGNNGPDGVNCAREVCSGTNGPMDGPSGTPMHQGGAR